MSNGPLDRTPEEQEALYKAFARVYMDPTGAGYQSAVKTYKLVVDPEPPEFSLKKQPYRYLHHRVTKTEMARIKTEVMSVVAVRSGITLSQYVEECWKMGQLFKERGMVGDSTAAVQAMKLVGQALGFETPEKRQAPLPRALPMGEMIVKVEGQLAMLKQLQAAQDEPVEADFTIEEETNGTDQGERKLRRPDDGG